MMRSPEVPPTGAAEAHRPRLAYLPGLDGLRALAVLAVLLYHADLPWIPGGFLGVEISFVLSGYLITSLLLAEWLPRQRIDLKAFWLRRARRLVPALLLLVGSTLAYAVLFLPDEVASLRAEAVAAVGYASNWYLVFAHRSYFETMGRPSLLRHMWSLAVEGQFYLLWPLLLAAGLRRWPRRRVVLAILLGAAASAALMAALYDPDVDPSRVYFGTDTRAAGLLAGAALAFAWTPGQLQGRIGRLRPLALDAIGLAALGALAGGCLWIDEFQSFLYRGGFAAIALATVAAIAVAAHPRARLVPRLLGAGPLRWLGQRSYSIYLWHWPVCMVTRPRLDLPADGLPVLVLRLLVTAVLAELSYRLVEAPIRRGRLGRAWGTLCQARGPRRLWLSTQWAGSITALVVLSVALGESIVTAEPPPPPSYLSVESIDTLAMASTPPATATPPAQVTATPAATSTPQVPAILATAAPATVAVPPTVALPTVAPPAAAPPAVLPPPPALSDERAPTSTPTATPVETTHDDMPSTSAEAAMVRSHAALTPAPVLHVTAIGDSVMLGAVPELQEAIAAIDIDAAVGRQAPNAIQVLGARRDAGQLGAVVVVHLGSNGIFRAEQLDETMEVLAGVDRVVFVNVRVPRRWQDPVNEMLADGVGRYPNAEVVDWYAASDGHPEWLREDGVHLSREGARAYAGLIAACIRGGGDAQ